MNDLAYALRMFGKTGNWQRLSSVAVGRNGRDDFDVHCIRQGNSSPEIHTLAEEANSSIAGERLTAALASLFGLLVAAIAGIYGLLSYIVVHRQCKINMCIALGARFRDITSLLGFRAFRTVAAGVAFGICGVLLSGAWFGMLKPIQ